MGAIWFSPKELPDHLHEIVGYKSGVAASIEQMADLLSGTGYDDDLLRSEESGIRIRSEDYDSLYYKLIHKIGVTEEPYEGVFGVMSALQELSKEHGQSFVMSISNIYQEGCIAGAKRAAKAGKNSIDPTPMLMETLKKHGEKGAKVLLEIISCYENHRKLSPNMHGRFNEWKGLVNLSDLFELQNSQMPTHGEFLDQRFINFLAENGEAIGKIHWRKFEELTAECFNQFGYKVELGPGSNDDGVDVRVWHPDVESAPHYIVQCKRQKKKVDKVTIKGLYADVLHEKAQQGLLVTTTELSPGAKHTIQARQYPIEEVNGSMVLSWVKALRTPGAGIVRV